MRERDNLILGMPVQERGGEWWPIACYSTQLDSVAHAYPNCLKATATAAKVVDASVDLTSGNDFIHKVLPHFEGVLILN